MKRWQVMIVEDEMLIRMGIRLSTPWEQFNMQVAAEAADGVEALELYERLRPEVVLFDIRMPGMDGLTLATRIRQQSPDCVLIAITCMDDFDTLHGALGLHLFDYLLKATMTPDSLSETLQRVRTHLEAHCPMESASPAAPPASYLPGLLYGSQTDVSGQLGYSPERLICLFQPDAESTRIAMRLLGKYASDRYSHLGAWLVTEGDDTAVLLSRPGLPAEEIHRCVAALQQHCIQLFSLPFQALGVACHEASPPIAYAEANRLYDRGYWMKDGAIALDADEHWQKACRACAVQEIIGHASSRELPDAFSDQWIERLKGVAPENIEAFQDLLIESTLEALSPLNCSPDDAAALSRRVLRMPGARQAAAVCLDFMVETTCARNGALVRRPEIAKALHYINRHFAENLSNSDVAQHVCLSPHYFSNLFRQELGVTFVDYLTQQRINHAKKLLRETDLYSYEIAVQCGYGDDAYFSRLFKKHTGLTPGAYRAEERDGK